MSLLETVSVSGRNLKNRIALAPMTRLRAEKDGRATPTISEFYRQRAGFGLIITEGIYPNQAAKGYSYQPGLATDAHEESWAEVVDEVHKAGGVIAAQIMPAGRAALSSVTGLRPVGPSAIAIPGEGYGPEGKVEYEVPKELTVDDIAEEIEFSGRAAERAIRAGFDFVEIHGANGYLPHQFLASSANQRDDSYGGSSENRARFLKELIDRLAAGIHPGKIGLRLSPRANIQGLDEGDNPSVWDTYAHVVAHAATSRLGYLSIASSDLDNPGISRLTRIFNGALLLNDSDYSTPTTRAVAENLLEKGASMAVVGRAGLSNPDLPFRWSSGAAVNEARQELFYTHEKAGYIDYPKMSD